MSASRDIPLFNHENFMTEYNSSTPEDRAILLLALNPEVADSTESTSDDSSSVSEVSDSEFENSPIVEESMLNELYYSDNLVEEQLALSQIDSVPSYDWYKFQTPCTCYSSVDLCKAKFNKDYDFISQPLLCLSSEFFTSPPDHFRTDYDIWINELEDYNRCFAYLTFSKSNIELENLRLEARSSPVFHVLSLLEDDKDLLDWYCRLHEVCDSSIDMDVHNFLREVYYFRVFVEDFIDHGLRPKNLESQGGYISRVALAVLADPEDTTITDIKEYVTSLCRTYWDRLMGNFRHLSSTLKESLNTAYTSFTRYLVNGIFGSVSEYIVDITQANHKTIIRGISLFCFWVIIKLMGLVSDHIANAMYSVIVNKSGASFFGQADYDIYGLVAALGIGIIGLKNADLSKVKSHVSVLISLMAGGSILTNCFKSLLVCLPSTLKTALIYRFGSEDQIVQFEIESWRAVALSLNAVSRIQSVIGSKVYEEKVTAQVKSGGVLIKKMPQSLKPGVRTSFTQTYVKLITIYGHIVTRKNNSGDRSVPFSFHVSGPPGIGKSSSTKDLLVQACDLTKDQMYSKDVSDEYFSGLMNHPAIIMDEWLVGPIEDKMVKGQMYLAINSNTEWRPPFASVDDPNVGIKGSCCRPEIVVTINNQEYDRIDHSIDDAMQRRRRFVIKAKRSDKFVGQLGSDLNVDLSKYDDDEMRNRVWMTFDILPAMFSLRPKLIRKDLSYPELVSFVRGQYEQHTALMKRMDSNMNSSVIETKSPDEIIDEVLRDTYDIPASPMSIADAIKSVLSPFFGQGPSTCLTGGDLVYSDVVVQEVQTTGAVGTIIEAEEADEESILSRIIGKASGLSLGSIISATSALLVLIGSFSCMLSGVSYEADTFYGQSSKPKHSTRSSNLKAPRRPRALQSQGPVVYVVPLTTRGKTFNSIALGENWFLTYKHGLCPDELTELDVIVANVKGHLFECAYSDEFTSIFDDKDLVIFKLINAQMPKFKNIVKWFITEDEVEKTSNAQVVIDTERRMYTSCVRLKDNAKYYLESGRTEVVLPVAAEYNAPTEVGDCGLPVKILSGPLVNKILGIHVAGTGGSCWNPVGLASFVSRETIEMAMCPVGAQGPNLVSEERLSFNELFPIPSKTKFSKSCISEHMPAPTKKEPAIMSLDDPRSRGIDPVYNSLSSLYDTEQKELDENLLKRIEDEIYDKYEDEFIWPIGKRRLSFEEAGEGIPGIFNSIVTKTNSGYPLAHLTKRKGKTEFIWFEGTEMKCTDFYREMVETKVSQMASYIDGPVDHKFLMFLKDETLKQSKIDNVETRATFANDLASIHAFRMVFGATLIALTNNFKTTGFAVGFNQYSKDMNIFYQYLTEISERMVAGDYKKFDKRQQVPVQKAAYSIFSRLAKLTGATDSEINFLIQHETKSPIQVKNKLVTVKCANFSGCFLTTPINNLTNDIYLRYVFYKKYPGLSFDKHMRAIKLGDDHILAVGKDVELTPVEIGIAMEELGQQYTSAFKDEALRDTYDNFSEILFLGARPVRSLTGLWTGALRKETLYETPQWTRDHDGSLDQTVQGMIDCASQWDKEFFVEYVDDLKNAYRATGRNWIFQCSYTALHYNVLNRSADSGRDFPTFYGQGPVGIVNPTVVQHEDNLTQIITTEQQEGNEGSQVNFGFLSKSITSRDASLDFGTESYIRRMEFDWASTSAAGSVLYTWNVPFDLLILGNLNSVQNMGFMNYTFSQPDCDIMFQVNGTPVQQGALVVWFAPLSTSDTLVADIKSWTNYEHIFLTPNNNSTKEITIPYSYFKNYLNNRQGFTEPKSQSIGTLNVGVFSPLTTLTLPTTASVAVYTKFRSKFKLPRGRTVDGQGPTFMSKLRMNTKDADWFANHNDSPMETQKIKQGNVLRTVPMTLGNWINGSLNDDKTQRTRKTNRVYCAQGATYSTSSVTNDYHIGTIGGDMPNQTRMDTKNSQSTSIDAGLPLDNPPVSGGSIPIYLQYSSMSKALGCEPTVSLQMDQTMLHRQPERFRDKRITTLSYLCGRRGYVGSTTVDTSQAAGTLLNSFQMSSLVNYSAYGNTVPANVAVLNYFQRWKADIVMDIFCAKTVFHSLRVQIVTAYGVPSYTTASSSGSNNYPNEIIEFTGDQQWARVVIPYHAATDFLNTVGGEDDASIRDFSIGSIGYKLANPLKVSSSVVANTVVLHTFFSFENVNLYEPRPSPYVTFGDSSVLPVLVGQGPLPGETGGVEGDQETQIDTHATTASTEIYSNKTVCNKTLGEKFDYLVRDFTEVGRRHTWFAMKAMPGYSWCKWAVGKEITNDYSSTTRNIYTYSFFVHPIHAITRLYQAWSGHLKYRIIISAVGTSGNNAVPGPVTVSHIPSPDCTVTQTCPIGDVLPSTAGTANTTCFDSYCAVPGPAQIGKTGSSTATWASDTYLFKNPNAYVAPGLEILQSQSGNTLMIDVSVPFNSIYNMLPCQPLDYVGFMDGYNGRLCIEVPDLSTSTYDIRIYQAFGDDFRLHAFNPNATCTVGGYTTSGTVTTPVDGVQIGSNVYGYHT